MKGITIHNIDDMLAKLIKARAAEEGLSLNKTIKALLEQALGVSLAERGPRREDFREFLGVWTEADLAEFNAAVRVFDLVEDEDWK